MSFYSFCIYACIIYLHCNDLFSTLLSYGLRVCKKRLYNDSLVKMMNVTDSV